MKNEKGQVVLILVLVMTVALAIGISVVQRSLSDVSTSSKVEQSSRAFSAAEAGIEKAIQSGSPVPGQTLDNNSIIQGVDASPIPAANQALEYTSLTKEEMAQVWLVNPNDLTSEQYSGTTLDIYWGLQNISDPADKPAVEISFVYLSGGAYQQKKFFYDSNSSRASSNNFTDVSSGCSNTLSAITTSSGTDRKFFCKTTISGLNPTLILLRARVLYSGVSQPFAVKPVSGSLPVQARIFTATGTSGQTQRRIQVFRLDKVVPSFFDFAIFSAGDITK
ncbi:MAG: pilus assembly PilX N-terminal domain-containing protein [Candidatus Daviesbacteria bacterium]|nr:pilus assembly PilX N-terminal domain-containing protein [Candidatus Daviesbacteria bacterium]